MLALKLTLDIVFDRLLNPIIRHDAMGSLGYNNRLFTLRYNIQEDCSRLKGADAVVIKAVSYTSSNVKVGALSQRAVHYMQSVRFFIQESIRCRSFVFFFFFVKKKRKKRWARLVEFGEILPSSLMVSMFGLTLF